MKQIPIFLAVRAIGTEFAQRVYIPVVSIIGGCSLLLIALLVWFVTMSVWWWLLLAPVILLVVIFIAVAVIVGLLLKALRPDQTKSQHQQVKKFVDSLQASSEAIQTPKFIILFRLVKDVVWPSERGYVRELAANASSLKSGLQDIIASFK